MAGLVPAIYVFPRLKLSKNVDARDKPGHDGVDRTPRRNHPRRLSCWGVPPRISLVPPIDDDVLLPDRFRRWFAARGWSPREHQLALLAKARDDRSALLIAPTGAGKTLAGFLPTLVNWAARLLFQPAVALSDPAASTPFTSRR